MQWAATATASGSRGRTRPVALLRTAPGTALRAAAGGCRRASPGDRHEPDDRGLLPGDEGAPLHEPVPEVPGKGRGRKAGMSGTEKVRVAADPPSRVSPGMSGMGRRAPVGV